MTSKNNSANSAQRSSRQKSRPFSHLVYFRLVDRSPVTLELFMTLCRKYLSKHPGQKQFLLGVRATEMKRDVNVQTFDVSMEMVFDGIESYDKYRTNQRHLDFIADSAGMSSERSVYDSYIENENPPPRKRSQPKKKTNRAHR